MKLALLGYGKMGQIIGTLATEKGHEIVYKKGSNFETGTLSEAAVAIDFSVPEAAVDNITKCLDANIPIVSGTTGWLSEYEKVLKKCEACNGSFIYASNFSVGVNLFFDLNAYAAKLMAPWKEYTVSVEEIHHTEKKDAPSGTAITIAEGILEHSDKKNWELDTVSEENITITAKREADVKGTHRVDYESNIDTISIKHEAHTREGFAKGAILAAEWLVGKTGVYSMKDVLGLTDSK
ncbi:MAG TPA: 4-hydroxy-tetrahydrodipicolinate reductase [Flavobacteriaceae bacterium]|jgi:4-hydroxy-tetrahydrodipicolinate reductase|nr:4-hydroxy-tetrahydrodipicolinate reductase [Flavobacteriaceae bacterium]HIN99912.1 4-hydroxy-tetrahydrodipicolinate reductase [Flavobacteriaceae bacterium]|tara:strand:+ start:3846 stop:4556 length:711 start_codon:yes stop_codon:yes gene_type:complete